MKIEDLANLQSVLKCNKDKAKAKEIRIQKKVVDKEAKELKYEIDKLRAKYKDLKKQSVTMNGILAQSRNIVVINDIPISVMKYGRSMKISKAGTHLGGGWPGADVWITLDTDRDTVYAVYTQTNGHYYKKSKLNKLFKSKDAIVDISLKYLAGLLTGPEMGVEIYED